jgi:hypothetical protein
MMDGHSCLGLPIRSSLTVQSIQISYNMYSEFCYSSLQITFYNSHFLWNELIAVYILTTDNLITYPGPIYRWPENHCI